MELLTKPIEAILPLGLKIYDRTLSSWTKAWSDFDSRVEEGLQPDLPFTSGSAMGIAIFIYLSVCVLIYGFIEYRKIRLQLRWIRILYNAICVLLSAYVVVGIILFKIESPGTFACNPLDTSKRGHNLAFVFWVFYMQKYWEFLDTWFYILRRSYRQVTVLHLFHHVSIIIVVGIILRVDFSGDMYFPVLLNALAHVLMYTHYLLTSCGLKSYWRPYLTSTQILQFAAICVQSAKAYSGGPSCGPPDFVNVMLMMYMASLMILFVNFFISRYILHKSTASMCGVIKSLDVSHDECFSGNKRLDSSGRGTVVLSNLGNGYSETLAPKPDFQYQLTPIGEAMPQLHVEHQIRMDDRFKGAFVISGGKPFGQVSWLVRIVQHDKTTPTIKKLQ